MRSQRGMAQSRYMGLASVVLLVIVGLGYFLIKSGCGVPADPRGAWYGPLLSTSFNQTYYVYMNIKPIQNSKDFEGEFSLFTEPMRGLALPSGDEYYAKIQSIKVEKSKVLIVADNPLPRYKGTILEMELQLKSNTLNGVINGKDKSGRALCTGEIKLDKKGAPMD